MERCMEFDSLNLSYVVETQSAPSLFLFPFHICECLERSLCLASSMFLRHTCSGR
jgi:hypothetical protein